MLKDALEMRLEVRIPSNHNILSWLVEFAGTVVNRYEVGRDSKTLYERLRGKQSRLIGFEFGEKVNSRRTAVGARMAKLDSLWSDGVFLGYRSISGEIVVGTKNGVFKTRTVQRKAYEHRWGKENLDMVGGVPWKTTPDEDEEEAIMPAIDIGMEMPEVEIPRLPTEDRRVKDIERHGATVNCKGCVLSSCCLVFMMIEQSHVLDVEHHNIAPPSVDLWLIRRARFVPLKETSMIVTVC